MMYERRGLKGFGTVLTGLGFLALSALCYVLVWGSIIWLIYFVRKFW